MLTDQVKYRSLPTYSLQTAPSAPTSGFHLMVLSMEAAQVNSKQIHSETDNVCSDMDSTSSVNVSAPPGNWTVTATEMGHYCTYKQELGLVIFDCPWTSRSNNTAEGKDIWKYVRSRKDEMMDKLLGKNQNFKKIIFCFLIQWIPKTACNKKNKIGKK